MIYNGPVSWMDEAACVETGGDFFFPDKDEHDKIAQAKALCASCDVRARCLMYALDNNIDKGIWGGMAPRQRAGLKRRRAA